ncbi:MAG TPA: nucleotide exchange factor GrpE [Acidobacteriaceae bacterium]|nr:nucleotide exchange factor GrpE [Acidobacteriaceae bacterium]
MRDDEPMKTEDGKKRQATVEEPLSGLDGRQQGEERDPRIIASAEQEQDVVPRAEVDRLQNERDQLLDRLARLQADFDNHRKREARERTEYRDYALVSAIEQFLPVLDNFQLALRSQGTADQLRSGVDLIVRQMEEILRALGVQPVATSESRFDPRLHEAIEMVDRDDLPDQQVLEEVRRGYTLRDRLLRPALVRVANNPKQKSA